VGTSRSWLSLHTRLASIKEAHRDYKLNKANVALFKIVQRRPHISQTCQLQQSRFCQARSSTQLYSKLRQPELTFSTIVPTVPSNSSSWHNSRHATWGHMYNAFEGLAPSSARPRQHEYSQASQVSNNEGSVFHTQTLIRAKMSSPHDVLSILGSTPDSDRGTHLFLWTSAVVFHGTSTTRTPQTRRAHGGGYVHCFATHRAVPPDVIRASRMHYSSKAAGRLAFARRARILTSPMRRNLAGTKR